MSDAIVVPGGRWGPAVPLLMYAGDVAERRGAKLHRHEWSARPPDPFAPAVEGWVGGELAPVLNAVGGAPLLIAKSLGTNAAALAADRDVGADTVREPIHQGGRNALAGLASMCYK